MAIRIEPGMTIRWQTPASRRIDSWSFSNKREGVYMGLLPPGTKAETVCPELKTASSSSKKFGSSCGTSSLNRVIVKVPRFDATTGEAIEPYWYGPRVSSVTHVFDTKEQWVAVNPKEVQWS